MEVGITRIRDDVELPQYKTAGAACFDLASADEVLIESGACAYLPTGLIIQIPKGHGLIILPRSSTPKMGLAAPHSIGLIDSDYGGPEDEIKLLVKNVTNTQVKVEKGQRVAQAFFLPIDKVEWLELSLKDISKNTRGGFGSTGKK